MPASLLSFCCHTRGLHLPYSRLAKCFLPEVEFRSRTSVVSTMGTLDMWKQAMKMTPSSLSHLVNTLTICLTNQARRWSLMLNWQDWLDSPWTHSCLQLAPKLATLAMIRNMSMVSLDYIFWFKTLSTLSFLIQMTSHTICWPISTSHLLKKWCICSQHNFGGRRTRLRFGKGALRESWLPSATFIGTNGMPLFCARVMFWIAVCVSFVGISK